MKFGNFSFEIKRKKIKHIYFRVYLSEKKIIVSAPVQIDHETLNRVILSRTDWLKDQIKKKKVALPELVHTYATGEELMFKGGIYPLYVNKGVRPRVFIAPDKTIHLVVKPGSDVSQREKIVIAWYREKLKQSIGLYVDKWQPIMGVVVNEFNVKKMKTRWGSCNINAQRIWLNLALIKLDPCFLEYVVVHEMVHLLEKNHNARFKRFMDQFIPDWKRLKKQLDGFLL
jgi:hypothetical protein